MGQYFGDLPIHKNLTSALFPNINRSSSTEIYNLIVADLNRSPRRPPRDPRQWQCESHKKCGPGSPCKSCSLEERLYGPERVYQPDHQQHQLYSCYNQRLVYFRRQRRKYLGAFFFDCLHSLQLVLFRPVYTNHCYSRSRTPLWPDPADGCRSTDRPGTILQRPDRYQCPC